MRVVKTSMRLGGLFVASLLLLAQETVADVLIWASDSRSGQVEPAEQSEWVSYLSSQLAQSPAQLMLPSQAGVSADYPLHLQSQPDMGALMASRLSTSTDAALWMRLSDTGLIWVLERNGQGSQLTTTATSDGLFQGMEWLRAQLSEQGAVTSEADLFSGMASDLSLPRYQHPGEVISVSGVIDAADFLRLTQALRALEGVDYVYPARLDRTDVDLVIGSPLSSVELQQLLLQQAWLRPTEQGELRWDSMALPLTQVTGQLQGYERPGQTAERGTE